MDATPDIDLSEWYALADRQRARFLLLAAVMLTVAVAAPFVCKTVNGGLVITAAMIIPFIVALRWGARSPVDHPFLRMLAWQRDDVQTIYEWQLSVNGAYRSTWLTLRTALGDDAGIDVPRAEVTTWVAKLRALVPNAEYRNEVPPS